MLHSDGVLLHLLLLLLLLLLLVLRLLLVLCLLLLLLCLSLGLSFGTSVRGSVSLRVSNCLGLGISRLLLKMQVLRLLQLLAHVRWKVDKRLLTHVSL